MSTPRTIDGWLQHNFRALTEDDELLAYLASGCIDGVPDYSPKRWQLAVDMIYRSVVSGLSELTYPKYRADHMAFFHEIKTRSPFDRGGEGPFGDSGGVLWNWEQLYGTDKLATLIDKHFPKIDANHDEIVNPAFIQELHDIFAAAGVPWSDAPLLPIITGNNSASD